MTLPRQIARILAVSALTLVPDLVTAQSGPASIPSGPAVGEKIPEFEAVDQSGRRQTFATLKGAKGLLLLFHRSADW